MENYERLTLELLGNGTPREKYEYVKWLLNIHDLYTKTKLSLEDDMEYFGNTNSRHTQALRTYNILNGTLEYIPNYEDLRREFYKVMEYTQPFGNEYHDDLFNWMWSKIRKQSELKCDTPINKEETKCEDFEPFGWTPLQIATYAINCPKEDKYFEEVAHMIERYADTKIWQELELPSLQQPSDTFELEQKLSACEIVLEDTQEKLKHLHNKIMVQWEKDFGSIHNEQTMDAYTVSGFVRNILGTDRQT